MKKIALTAAFLAAPAFAAGGNPLIGDQAEVCVKFYGCALMVQTNEYEGNIYLVKSEEEYLALSLQWPGARFYPLNDDEYAYVKGSLNLQTVSFNAAKKPGGNPSGGPLVTGSISMGNINIGSNNGGGSCGDCHRGNWYEIHKKKLESPTKTDQK